MAKKKTAKKKTTKKAKKGPLRKMVDEFVDGVKARVAKRQARRKKRSATIKKKIRRALDSK